MFKKVEYVGFEGRPELRAPAERATATLADVVGARQAEVEVRWSPHPNRGAGFLDLTLSRVLVNGVSAAQTTAFVPDDFDRDRDLVSRCNRAWDDLLGLLLDKQHKRVQELFLEPTEA